MILIILARKSILNSLYRPAGTLHDGGAKFLRSNIAAKYSKTKFTIFSFTRAPGAKLL